MDQLQSILSFQPSISLGNDQSSPQEHAVKLGWNTCYIVCGMVIKDDKVLMIQEAKQSCRGKWYMPAGRVERNESLEDAVRREVKEESGYEFDPKALIGIEFQSFSWVRFTFIGDVIGGKLKTPDEEDKESIQAQWMPADIKQIKYSSLRAPDCLPLIDLARKWHLTNDADRYKQLIVPNPHTSSSINVILIRQNGDEMFVLLVDGPGGSSRIPSSRVENYSVRNEIDRIVKLSGYSGEYVLHGFVSVEHQVDKGDGIQVTVLLSTTVSGLNEKATCGWQKITDQNNVQSIRGLMKSDNSLIHLINLW